MLAVRNVQRYFWLLLVLLAGFAVLGVYQYQKSKVFEAKTSFLFSELQMKTYGEMVDKLQDMIKYKSYGRLATALKLPENQAAAILDIKAENRHGSKLSEDISDSKTPFYIKVVAVNNQVFDTLQGALESYLNNNTYVQEMLARKARILQQNIAYGRRELAMLDSLKIAYTRSLDKPASSVYPSANAFNPVTLYEKGEKINQDLATMQAQLDDHRAVYTLDKFMVTEGPMQKSVWLFGLRYLIFFAVASIVLMFILSIFRK